MTEPITLVFADSRVQDEALLQGTYVIGGQQRTLWFKFDWQYYPLATSLADPFVIGMLFDAMEAGTPIKVQGRKLSRGLVFNLMEFQRMWHKWRPDKYSVVQIHAEEEEDRRREAGVGGIAAFTGGVDSSFILHQNLHGMSPLGLDIRAALFVQGFDIPLDNHIDFEATASDIQPIPDSAGIPLIRLSTNLREIGNWNDTHGAAIAACLTIFGKSFRFGVLGSSHPYNYLRLPWGSNPVSDPLLSSDFFRLINYGGGFSRMEKLRLLSAWPVCHGCLRVCTKYFNRNCGTCEKCMRTKLCYWTLGKPIPTTFVDRRIRAFDVVRILAFKEQEIKDYSSVFRAARRRSGSHVIVFSLGLNLIMNWLLMHVDKYVGKPDLPPTLLQRFKKLFTS